MGPTQGVLWNSPFGDNIINPNPKDREKLFFNFIFVPKTKIIHILNKIKKMIVLKNVQKLSERNSAVKKNYWK